MHRINETSIFIRRFLSDDYFLILLAKFVAAFADYAAIESAHEE